MAIYFQFKFNLYNWAWLAFAYLCFVYMYEYAFFRFFIVAIVVGMSFVCLKIREVVYLFCIADCWLSAFFIRTFAYFALMLKVIMIVNRK